MSELFWGVAALISVAVLAGTLVHVIRVWMSWVIVNVEGAGRKVFVGIHGWSGDGIVKPHPLDPERTTLLKGPFVRPYAFVNPDRDELRFEVPFTPEGAPASTEEGDEARVELRVSWSIPAWVPHYDIPGEPGDHGKIPRNLRVGRRVLFRKHPKIVEQFESRRVRGLLSRPRWYLPGAAVIAYMNKYTEGEHLVRLFEFATQHAREFLGSFNIRELERVNGEHDSTVHELRNRTARIRKQDVKFQGDNPDDPLYIPIQYSNMGEFQRVCSHFLTRVLELEMEVYGVFVNDVTVVRWVLPKRLVQASRTREARKDEVAGMKTFSDGLKDNVQSVANVTGMDPNVAGLVIADTISEGRPGIFGVLLTALQMVKGRT